MTDITGDVIELARNRAAELAASAPDVDAAQAEAAAAARRAQEAADAARRARLEADPRQVAAGMLPLVMRRLGARLDELRAAALDAVATGSDPATAWCRYRLTAAEVAGEWVAFTTWYSGVTGGNPPPGPIEHRLPPLPAPPGEPVRPNAEDFNGFVTAAMRRAERATTDRARQQAQARYWAMTDPTPTERKAKR